VTSQQSLPNPRRVLTVGLVLILGMLGAVFAPAAAYADGASTTTKFVKTDPVAVDFGTDWLIAIKVATNDYPVVLDETSGSVDVFLSGISNAYAPNLPLQPGGLAYFAQPSDKPPLGAGEYTVSAVFKPTAGSGLKTSQTSTPVKITVASIAVNPSVKVADDPAVASVPTITASFSGAYVDKVGGAPPGVWSFVVANSSGSVVFDSKIAQVGGDAKPLVIGIDSGIKRGTDYTVTSTFTPAENVAGGLALGSVPTATFHSADGSFGDQLAAPVALPIWLFLIILVFVLALIVATVIFARRVALAPRAPAPAHPTTQPKFLAEPAPDELMSLSDVGLGNPPTERVSAVSGAEPAGGWSLSDDTPATAPANNDLNPHDDRAAGFPFDLTATPPTELLDPGEKLAPVDQPTERIDTAPTNPGASSD
jgi:hypothetical protein